MVFTQDATNRGKPLVVYLCIIIYKRVASIFFFGIEVRRSTFLWRLSATAEVDSERLTSLAQGGGHWQKSKMTPPLDRVADQKYHNLVCIFVCQRGWKSGWLPRETLGRTSHLPIRSECASFEQRGSHRERCTSCAYKCIPCL